MKLWHCASTIGLMALLSVSTVLAQDPPAANAPPANPGEVPSVGRAPAMAMRDIIKNVTIENAPARDAFDWWSRTTGITLVINWTELEAAGIDPDSPINLTMQYVPASQLLGLMMQQISAEVPLIYETTQWYVQVMTKAQANKQTVLRVYLVGDLITNIPNFEDAPAFDLQSVLGNTKSGGGAGGGSNDKFFVLPEPDTAQPKSKQERGEELAALVRDTIEPTIWIENGGEYATVRYFDNRLIVNAPRYVHAQIGYPVSAGRATSTHAAK